ncbi:MAG: hypothetical protein IT307_02160 [Chloroflexi bacterium]|nr:hypothetical protein [Chloroflexota bacterium]
MTQPESNDRTNEFTPGRFDEQTSTLASEPTDTTLIFGAQRPADNTVSFEAPTQFVASTPRAAEQGTVTLGGRAFAEPKHDSTLTFSEEETAYLRAQGETTASQLPQDDAWTTPIQPGTVGSSKRGSALRGLAAVSLGVVAAAAIAGAVYFRGGFDGAASTADSQTDGAAVEIAAPADITAGDEAVAVAPATDQPVADQPATDQPAQVAVETAPPATTDQPSGPVASADTVPPATGADTASGADVAAPLEAKPTEPTTATTGAQATAAADSASQADPSVAATAASKADEPAAASQAAVSQSATSQAAASQAAAADRDASKGDRHDRDGDSKSAAESAQIASTAVDTSVGAASAVADTTTNSVVRAQNGDRSAPIVPTLPKLPAFGRR